MRNIWKLLNQGKYPIVHPDNYNPICDECGAVGNPHCSHFVVVTDYNKDLETFFVRIVTNSACCGNVKVDPDDVVITSIKPVTVKYISSSDGFMGISCLMTNEPVGYLINLP